MRQRQRLQPWHRCDEFNSSIWAKLLIKLKSVRRYMRSSSFHFFLFLFLLHVAFGHHARQRTSLEEMRSSGEGRSRRCQPGVGGLRWRKRNGFIVRILNSS